tara:strand:+ start:379 stop:525 length:147 start_codon:yes stop_codon:yes gene_type:complete
METLTWNPGYFIDLTDLNGMQTTPSHLKQTPYHSALATSHLIDPEVTE